MLKYLHIDNIAVIEHSEIEFDVGFNVLTGETGAGKSILIDAINAVLGERTSKDLIRAGCDSAEVSAVFCDLGEEITEILTQFDLSPDEEGNLVITRKLKSDGKGFIKINGKPISATVLREFSSLLINIHGQHDNQALLNPDKHVAFIDAVAGNEEQIAEYYEEFKCLNKIRKELKELELNEDEKQHKTELLKYQINELETADIKIGEVEELKARLKIAENYEDILKALSLVTSVLSGGDDSDGVLTMLKVSLKRLTALKGDEFNGLSAKMQEALSLLEDVNSDTAGYLDSAQLADLDIDSINQRLDTLSRLMLKYGNGEEEMLEFLKNAKKELSYIEFSDKRISELSALLDASTLRLIELGRVVTDSRTAAARKFEKEVCGILAYLNMPNTRFFTEIKQGRYTKNGCDEIEFLISANSGENLKPLQKIASGGELSRIMLAIKSSLLDKDNVGTMIFDEIDTGISGFAADKVGTQLKKVSSGRQVICVTHLAQIAARADNHLLIEKSDKNGRTFTAVNQLDYEGRIREIARIMSGTSITENLYNSAKELLDRS